MELQEMNEQWGDIVKAVLATAGGLTATFLGYQQWSVKKAKDDTTKAGEFANTEAFTSLQQMVEFHNKELMAVRTEMSRMDRTIHVQQRTITRMEMLIRQFSSLVREQGIEVPEFMQAELDDLMVKEKLDGH
jgi:hypothetical protein